jgi:polyisoprenoid-binding protein YceI
MKKFILCAFFLPILGLSAQVYKTSTGKIKFFSKTTAENIDATSSQVVAAVASTTGVVEFMVSVNSFQFQKALMQKHFQENYMETSKYPKSSFKGTIQNNSAVKYGTAGTYSVTVKGKLTMHGVTKDVMVTGSVVVTADKVTLKADFNVNLDDYKIKVPAENASQVAKTIKVTVDCPLTKK